MNPTRNWLYGPGWLLSGLVAAFLVMDASMKLLALPVVIQFSGALGFAGVGLIRTLGAILLASTILYLAPRTAVLGAILLTGYLGGAVAAKVRVDAPMFSNMLFGVYLGVMVWGGLYLREPRIRALIPLRRIERPA
jgi:hypothetical protein